jgi:TfoX/Sxy family transcriptional regulator of competence genes
MMGEYIVYVEDKVIGQINEGQLFIKATLFGEQFAPDLKKQAPYEGAKLALVVPFEMLADTEWLGELISGTVQQIPKPSSRKKR